MLFLIQSTFYVLNSEIYLLEITKKFKLKIVSKITVKVIHVYATLECFWSCFQLPKLDHFMPSGVQSLPIFEHFGEVLHGFLGNGSLKSHIAQLFTQEIQ